MGSLDAVVVTVSHNISFVGKVWWLLMVVLRLTVVLLAGFTLFSDEQERFICNTIQPGCSNVCFNLFAPVSLFRVWLLHIVLLCLPHLLFATYVAHRLLWEPNLVGGAAAAAATAAATDRHGNPGSPFPTAEISHLLLLHQQHLHHLHPRGPDAPSFHCAYLLAVVARILLEAALVACHFLFFGLSVPRSFLCYEAPCTSGVECYISRPTEKTLMLNLMLGLACLSAALSLVDLVGGARGALGRRRREKAPLEEMSKGEQSSLSSNASGAEDTSRLLNTRKVAGDGFDGGADRAVVVAAAAAKGGTGAPTEEKSSPWKPNGVVGPPTQPRATPLGHFVLHNPPELAGTDHGPPPRLETFATAGPRRQGGLLASVGSACSSKENSVAGEAPDKRAWV